MMFTTKITPDVTAEFYLLIKNASKATTEDELKKIITQAYNIVSDISLEAFKAGMRFDSSNINENSIIFEASKLKD